MDLQAVTPVFDNVGVDKARHDPLEEEHLAQTLGEKGGSIRPATLGFDGGYHVENTMVAAGWGFECGPVG